jgi:DNA-binding response OmpR family regulator
MKNVFVIDWNSEGQSELEKFLTANGYSVETEFKDSGLASKKIRKSQPSLIIINYDKLPSHGRQMAKHLQEHHKTDYIPVLFVGGTPEDVDKLRLMELDRNRTDMNNLITVIKRFI